MFCPRCGNGGQEPETYCRNCGQFLLDFTGRSLLLKKLWLWRGSTPANQVYLNLALNFITILTCILLIGLLNGYYDAREARTGEGTPGIVYLIDAFLIVISLWQFLSIGVGVRLGRKLRRKGPAQVNTNLGETSGSFASMETKKLLNQPLLNENLPISVTEEPTRVLNQSTHK